VGETNLIALQFSGGDRFSLFNSQEDDRFPTHQMPPIVGMTPIVGSR